MSSDESSLEDSDEEIQTKKKIVKIKRPAMKISVSKVTATKPKGEDFFLNQVVSTSSSQGSRRKNAPISSTTTTAHQLPSDQDLGAPSSAVTATATAVQPTLPASSSSDHGVVPLTAALGTSTAGSSSQPLPSSKKKKAIAVVGQSLSSLPSTQEQAPIDHAIALVHLSSSSSASSLSSSGSNNNNERFEDFLRAATAGGEIGASGAAEDQRPTRKRGAQNGTEEDAPDELRFNKDGSAVLVGAGDMAVTGLTGYGRGGGGDGGGLNWEVARGLENMENLEAQLHRYHDATGATAGTSRASAKKSKSRRVSNGGSVKAAKAAAKEVLAAEARKKLARVLPPSFGLGTKWECFDAFLTKGGPTTTTTKATTTAAATSTTRRSRRDGGEQEAAAAAATTTTATPSLGISLKNIEEKAVVRGFAPWRLQQAATKGGPFQGVVISGTEVRVNDVIVSVNNLDARGEPFRIVMAKLRDASMGPIPILDDGDTNNSAVCVRFARPVVDASVLEALEVEAEATQAQAEQAKLEAEALEASREAEIRVKQAKLQQAKAKRLEAAAKAAAAVVEAAEAAVAAATEATFLGKGGGARTKRPVMSSEAHL
jgi:hypothetical protein